MFKKILLFTLSLCVLITAFADNTATLTTPTIGATGVSISVSPIRITFDVEVNSLMPPLDIRLCRTVDFEANANNCVTSV